MKKIQQPIAELGQLHLFQDSVVQQSRSSYRSMALKSIEYCYMRTGRRWVVGVAAIAMALGAVGVVVTQFGDGPLYWMAVAAALLATSIGLFRVWHRSRSAFIMLLSPGGVISARVGAPTEARTFIDTLMKTRGQPFSTEPEDVTDGIPTPNAVADKIPAPAQ